MPDYAYTIKESVTMQDVCDRYGIEVNHQHKAMCPFHTDIHPSMHIYPGNHGFHCFVCEAGGSVIDFVMAYFGLDYKEAIRKINDDFNLGLPIDTKLTGQARREADRQAYERRKKMQAEKDAQKRAEKAYQDALDEWVRLDTIERETRPTGQSEPCKAWFDAKREIQYAAYLLDQAETKLYMLRQRKRMGVRK